MEKEVIEISIHKGLASLVKAPKNKIVIIRDYDVEGMDSHNLTCDSEGSLYQEIVLDGDEDE